MRTVTGAILAMNLEVKDFVHRDVEEADRRLREIGARKILLQLPDGLKPYAFDYFTYLSQRYDVILSSSPVYGACDIGPSYLYDRVDAIVQVGHSIMRNVKYPRPVIFIEHYRTVDVEDINTEALKNYRRIGLIYSIQYRPVADRVKRILESKGFEVIIGRSDRRMTYDGQVLGCNFSSVHSVEAEVEAFVIVSTGSFHALGSQISTERPVFLLDLNEMSLRSMEKEADTFIRKRYAQIYRAMDAKRICFLVDTRIGQRREKLARMLMDRARDLGKEAVLAYTDNISDQDIQNMGCDLAVYTGCPRVPIDDQDRFTVPVLTPAEFSMAFLKSTKRYVLDEIVSVDEFTDQ